MCKEKRECFFIVFFDSGKRVGQLFPERGFCNAIFMGTGDGEAVNCNLVFFARLSSTWIHLGARSSK